MLIYQKVDKADNIEKLNIYFNAPDDHSQIPPAEADIICWAAPDETTPTTTVINVKIGDQVYSGVRE